MIKLFSTVITLVLLAVTIQTANAQIAIGEWRDHLPYNQAFDVADADPLVYTATKYSLFYYDKDDYSVNRLSKVNGLSDIGISSIAFSKEYNTLVIAYNNTNLDLIKDGNIINISDIKNKQILGNKFINDIYISGNLAYLACGFGIVVLDVDKMEFPDPTYYIGDEGSQVNVYGVTIGHDSIFAATEAGIYHASLNSPNLADYNSWSIDQRIYPDEAFTTIAYYSDRLVVNQNNEVYNTDTVFYYDFNTYKWEHFPDVDNLKKFSMNESNGKFMIVGQPNISIYNADYDRILFIDRPDWKYLNSRNATIDDDNLIWIADVSNGLISTPDGKEASFVKPNGPYSSSVFDMSLQNEQLWVASGGRSPYWGKLYLRYGVYTFNNESWKSYNNASGYQIFDTISDMVCIAADPNTKGHVFIGTWMDGVIEMQDDEVLNVYNENNSSLQLWPAANFVAVSGLDFDSYNNLWAVNSGASNLLSVRKTDGTWKSFSLGSTTSGTDASKLVIDSYNQKWIMLRAEHKLQVFTDNGTIDDPTDDISKVLTNATGNGALPGNKIYSVAQDLDGELWIGSDEGIGVIYSPGNVFTGGNYDAQRILVEVGGYTQYLLESETVTAIAVDGDNRKWIGTERAGVFLLSADGTEEIHHFTEENSQLYSNLIVDIQINGETGEVFFGTDRGILSYKSTATEGGPTNSNVVVYPNPVREGYAGVIAIKGLVSNADVKITDVSGTLVYATKAEGGQAIWSGYNFDGRKASTGVYLVFATDDQGEEKMVTKILFIN
jgi:streptogramin lyase